MQTDLAQHVVTAVGLYNGPGDLLCTCMVDRDLPDV